MHSILSAITAIQLCGQKISILDSSFLKPFLQLESLDLTGNLLTSLTLNSEADTSPFLFLPSTLKYLNLSANKISNLPNLSTLPNLIHLNLSYNELSNLPDPLSSALPLSLQSFDCTFNAIENLNCLSFLSHLPNLKLVSFMGNPVCLSPQYTSILASTLPHVLLDGALAPISQVTASPVSQDKGKISVYFGNLLGLSKDAFSSPQTTSLPTKGETSKSDDIFMYSFSFLELESEKVRLIDNQTVPFLQLLSMSFIPNLAFRNRLIDPVTLVCKRHLIRNEVKQIPSSPGGKTKKKKPAEQLLQVCVESKEFFSIDIDLSPFLFNTPFLVYTPSVNSPQPFACEVGCFLNDFTDQFTLEKLNTVFAKKPASTDTVASSSPIPLGVPSRNKKAGGGDT